jgi:hypothetical protein
VAREVSLSFGGFHFRLTAAGPPLVHEADAVYRPFLRPGPADPSAPDTVHVRFGVSPRPAFEGRTILESTATWSILARGPERGIVFRLPSETEPAWVTRFRPDVPEVSVVCSPQLLQTIGGTTALRSSLFAYPLDQVLTMYLLGARGLVLHAAGALVGGRGVAFSGASGAGKSTLTGLAAGRPAWEPLNDDRVVVRIGGGVPARVWGTPWSGEGRVAEHRSGSLAWVLFLEHGEVDEIRPLTAAQALPRLLQTASLPWHDAEYLEAALAACDGLIRSVPCAVLTFRPETGAVEAVERLLARPSPSGPAC